MNASFDTNVLIYMIDRSDEAKRRRARQLYSALSQFKAIIAGQVVSEFLNAAVRKKILEPQAARKLVGLIAQHFDIVDCSLPHRVVASEIAEEAKIQYFDALLCKTLSEHGVRYLLSEDMNDGQHIGGLTISNPFNPANAARIRDALAHRPSAR